MQFVEAFCVFTILFVFHTYLQWHRNACVLIAFLNKTTNEFILHCAESIVAQNVKVRAFDPFTARITFGLSVKSCGRTIGYIVGRRRINTWQESINVYSSCHHVFTRLEPGETIFATAYARGQQDAPVIFDFISNLNNIQTISALTLE